MSDLKPGLRGEAKRVVDADNTAIAVGSGNVPVFATPMLIALMESASINAVAGKLPEGQSTVGTRVEVAHTSATPPGMTVTARAELIEVDRKRLLFKVTASDDAGQVGHGQHERFIIDLESFMSKAKGKK